MNARAFRQRGNLSLGVGSVSPALAIVLLPLAAAATATLCAALVGYVAFTLVWRTSRALARVPNRRETAASDLHEGAEIFASTTRRISATEPVVAPIEAGFATAA
jgi:hypothetical protein